MIFMIFTILAPSVWKRPEETYRDGGGYERPMTYGNQVDIRVWDITESVEPVGD